MVHIVYFISYWPHLSVFQEIFSDIEMDEEFPMPTLA